MKKYYNMKTRKEKRLGVKRETLISLIDTKVKDKRRVSHKDTKDTENRD